MVTKLSEEDVDRLPYPPDSLPGRRTVQTPYGTMNVYEWGPEDGRKVLFVHGISTPCIALSSIAHSIVKEAGCRVLLFDLFGRGYSDAPTNLRYDNRLYCTQILLALASSPLAWSGDMAFDMIGYSLGGGIIMDFASYFPNLPRSVILIAPGGLLRRMHISLKNKLFYGSSDWLPDWVVDWFITRTLRGPGSSVPRTRKDGKSHAGDAVAAEAGEVKPTAAAQEAPSFDAADVVNWSLQHHMGLVKAFVSSIKYAPTHEQQERWRVFASHLQNRTDKASKTLLVLGSKDPIVRADEVAHAAKEVLGEDNLSTVVIDAGHEVPMSHAGDIAGVIMGFWNGSR